MKTLVSRGLVYKSNSDKFGSPDNGNFLMSLELIASFDPFLASQIFKIWLSKKSVNFLLIVDLYILYINNL